MARHFCSRVYCSRVYKEEIANLNVLYIFFFLCFKYSSGESINKEEVTNPQVATHFLICKPTVQPPRGTSCWVAQNAGGIIYL